GRWTPRRPANAGKAAVKTGAPVGKPAPDFTLQSPDGKVAATLSSFQGQRPVALIFGSYT
ncbi:MAG: hypothetical protein OER88_13410, partial [Planctomycetota bacterium]|nr:hypothetical protein [Planctomycetota bacterium]